MTHRIVSRLAPSPTGVLHLGNARTFLLNWLWTRSRNGRLVLRIEDIDGPRVRPEASSELIEDLRWIGIDWDDEPVLQSARYDVHRTAVEELIRQGVAYPCVCSRTEVEEAASAPHEPVREAWQDAVVYPGTCRDRFESLRDAREQTGRDPAVRFRVDVETLPFEDAFRGAEDGRIRGDFVIQKRDGLPAYQLAVVVDDAWQGVTEVLRGDDLLASTPRQLLLYRALGLPEPVFAHVPLVVGPDGRRLAKRHGDTSLRGLRDAGFSGAQVRAWLEHSLGWPAGGSVEEFDLLSISPDELVIDREGFDALDLG
ncbi:MAG: tRNA glutamyl-Q(34) synthetase GluQRS [Planctomycetota bacterium]